MGWQSFKKKMKNWSEANNLQYEDYAAYKTDNKIEISGSYKEHQIKLICDRYEISGSVVTRKIVFNTRPLSRKLIDTPKSIKNFIDIYIENGTDSSRYNIYDYSILLALFLSGLIIGVYLLSLNW